MYLYIEIEFIHQEIIRASHSGDNQRGKRLPMVGEH
jgi:hypothetical protein